ncbi:DUF6457 domain-containing protein [Streptomyces sp. NPDC127072]|uniref:DUF6457 domain-containing protein n=1 Tax=Streptomyces sp. NPDC127072 TaxID=3347129 RepID=UPI00364E4BE2
MNAYEAPGDPAALLPYDAVVLAGGAARRLGGVDKPAVRVGGRALLDRVLAACADASNTVVVADPRPTARPVLWAREDPPGGGPVAALDAGLRHITAEYVVVLSADLPFLEAGTVGRLTRALQESTAGPAGAGLVPNIAAPADAGQMPGAAPVDAGRIPSTAAPVDAGREPGAVSPAGAGQIPGVAAPASTGSIPDTAAPADARRTPNTAAPVDAGRKPGAVSPADAGRTPSTAAPAHAGQIPSAAAPVDVRQVGPAGSPTRPDGVLLVDSEGRDQPLVAVYRVRALRRELDSLAAGGSDGGSVAGGGLGGLPLRKLIAALDLIRISDPVASFDCDTWDDIAAARARIREHGHVLDEWISAVKDELGIDLDVDTGALLDLARDAAHGVARPAAPLTTFLVGYAAARAGGGPEAVAEAARKAAALALRWADEDAAEAAAEAEPGTGPADGTGAGPGARPDAG